MKKNIDFRMLTLIMVALFSLSLLSCSSSDDTNNVVGTWVDNYGDGICTFTFRDNGTGVYVDQYNGDYGLETESINFKYRLRNDSSGDIIFLDEYGHEDEALPFLVDGNVMHIYEDDSYDDVEWVLYRK